MRFCPICGKDISSLRRHARACGARCKKRLQRQNHNPLKRGRRRLPDTHHIDIFMATEMFAEGTTFRRSSRLDSQGYENYWWVSCPICKSTWEALSRCLRDGQTPCLCKEPRQEKCYTYIHWILDEDNYAKAIKFGITSNTFKRLKDQSRRCLYAMRPHSVYVFDTESQAISAEAEILSTLKCGILNKKEMIDGYTETTCPSNLARIKMIYEKHGGTLWG